MFLNKFNPIYLFVVGFILVIIGALLKILNFPFSTPVLAWGLLLKLYAIIRFVILFNRNYNKNKEKAKYEEGCLSIPEHFAEVTRPSEVEVLWFDQNGAEHKAGFDGLWATCIQHEIDHLNGKLFIDYLGAIKRQMITRKMQKFKREIARGKAE
mgnify:CR=1 FL=1